MQGVGEEKDKAEALRVEVPIRIDTLRF
jgi:hypothetical protein